MTTKTIQYTKNANGINCGHTRESIADAIRFMAKVFFDTRNFAAADRLSELQANAVERFWYTWDEVEAIEIAAYSI